MITAQRTMPQWTEALPPLRGRISHRAQLGASTWLGVGGPAEVMFRPADEDDLAACLAVVPPEIPVTVIGVGSNLLVRDGGVAGLVIRLGRGFAEIAPEGVPGRTGDATGLRVGAAALDMNIAMIAAEAGIGGLEFLSGVPGTLGGGLRMNAGAYGGEMAGIVEHVVAIDRTGGRRVIAGTAMGFGYRTTAIPSDWVFTGARLNGTSDAPEAIRARLVAIRAAREQSQPIRAKTGGSTFRNPPGESAWRLIDRAGCRGLRRGGAEMSEKHCNFLINRSGATAADLEQLGEEVRRRVADTTGIMLEWEIKRIGEAAE